MPSCARSNGPVSRGGQLRRWKFRALPGRRRWPAAAGDACGRRRRIGAGSIRAGRTTGPHGGLRCAQPVPARRRQGAGPGARLSVRRVEGHLDSQPTAGSGATARFRTAALRISPERQVVVRDQRAVSDDHDICVGPGIGQADGRRQCVDQACGGHDRHDG